MVLTRSFETEFGNEIKLKKKRTIQIIWHLNTASSRNSNLLLLNIQNEYKPCEVKDYTGRVIHLVPFTNSDLLKVFNSLFFSRRDTLVVTCKCKEPTWSVVAHIILT